LYLHSFPTRRSSDLEAVRLSGEGGDPAERARIPPARRVRSLSASQDRDDSLCCGPARFRLSMPIDRSRGRLPPGALVLRELSVQSGSGRTPRPQQRSQRGPERPGYLTTNGSGLEYTTAPMHRKEGDDLPGAVRNPGRRDSPAGAYRITRG